MAAWSRTNDVLLQQEIENGRLLVEKAKLGDADGVKYLLEQGVLVNAETYNMSLFYKLENYWTPLHFAASRGFTDIVRLLIEYGADLDVPDMYDVTPVHLAAEAGHTDCLRLLLDAGALVNQGTLYRRPQWSKTNAFPHKGDTCPLHLAAKNNHLDCIRELILGGADYNAVDEDGRTSMYIAAEKGFEEAVLVHLRSAYGKTILSLPVRESDDTPLHQCVQHSLVAAVKELLAHGSDVNFLNRAGYSPLHSALQNPLSVESVEIVKALITLGYNTDINLKDAYGVTPLEYVCFKEMKHGRHPKLAALLITYGAKFLHLKNSRNVSLLQQELGVGVTDFIILRAIVKTMVHLPSLVSLGIYSEGQAVNEILNARFFMGRQYALGLGKRCKWYATIANSVRTLQHHCRVIIRDQLGPRRLCRVHQLPIPLSLQDYLLLEYDEYR